MDRRWWFEVAAVGLVFFAAIFVFTGCLPQEKKAEVDLLTDHVSGLRKQAEETAEAVVDAWESVQVAIERVKRGEIPLEQVDALMADYLALKGHKAKLESEIGSVTRRIEALRAEGVPWWSIVLAVGRGLLEGGGLGLIVKLLGRVSFLKSAMGVVSRAADGVAEDRIGTAINEEIRVITTSEKEADRFSAGLRTLHHAATAREI